MHFNIIDEQWLVANNKMYSVREALLQSDIITDIEAPTIINHKFHMYEYVAYRFLITLVSVALHNAPRTRMTIDTKFTDEQIKQIEDYLNANLDRFDLFDDTHPFMQWSDDEIAYATNKGFINDSNLSFDKGTMLTILPFMPSNDIMKFNRYVGYDLHSNATKSTTIKKDIIDNTTVSLSEYVYEILYITSIHGNAGSGGCSAISSAGHIFNLIKGKTLAETLLINVFPYDDSSDMKPMWEQNHTYDYFESMDLSKIIESDGYMNNIATFNFAPNRLFRIHSSDGHTVDGIIYEAFKQPDKQAITSDGTKLLTDNISPLLNTNDWKELCKNLSFIYSRRCDRDIMQFITEPKSDNDQRIYNSANYNRNTNLKTLLMAIFDTKMSSIITSGSIQYIFSRNNKAQLPKTIRACQYARLWDPKSRVYEAIDYNEEVIPITSDAVNETLMNILEYADTLANKVSAAIRKCKPKNGNANINAINSINMMLYEKLISDLFMENGITDKLTVATEYEMDDILKSYKSTLYDFIEQEYFIQNKASMKDAVTAFYPKTKKKGQ